MDLFCLPALFRGHSPPLLWPPHPLFPGCWLSRPGSPLFSPRLARYSLFSFVTPSPSFFFFDPIFLPFSPGPMGKSPVPARFDSTVFWTTLPAPGPFFSPKCFSVPAIRLIQDGACHPTVRVPLWKSCQTPPNHLFLLDEFFPRLVCLRRVQLLSYFFS